MFKIFKKNQTPKSNLPRFIMAGILAVIIAVMWVNNKNKAEALKLQEKNNIKNNIMQIPGQE